MSIENAELAKIAVNTYVTTKITFANMLSELCELIPGGDVDVVTHALGSDLRIGHKYLKGAIGYGGPCFPRDNVALSFMAQALGMRAHLAEATDSTNRSLAGLYAERLREIIPAGATVAVLGLAYKPHSHVVEESQGVALARAVARSGIRVVAYDPLAGEAARAAAPELEIADSVRSCLAEADVVLITTPDPEFVRLTPEDFPRRGTVVVDFWRVLDAALSGQPGIRYMPVGRGRDDLGSAELLRDLWSPALQEVAVG
jgi:UDPglucose 6-dehydrogenase